MLEAHFADQRNLRCRPGHRPRRPPPVVRRRDRRRADGDARGRRRAWRGCRGAKFFLKKRNETAWEAAAAPCTLAVAYGNAGVVAETTADIGEMLPPLSPSSTA
jgi:hypothetical protein